MNVVKITGQISDGYQDKPAVRTWADGGGAEFAMSFASEDGRGFVTVSHFGPLSGMIAKLPAGTWVEVEGQLTQDRWKNEAGESRKVHKVRASRVITLTDPATLAENTTKALDEAEGQGRR